MTDPTISQILSQIANLKHRNQVKCEEIAENDETINMLTVKLTEIYNQKLDQAMSPPQKVEGDSIVSD